MPDEAWLKGPLDGFAPLLMPAAHALAQAAADLENATRNLTLEELNRRPGGAPSVAFHLRHIAGSIDRLLTYAAEKNLNESQFSFLSAETEESNSTAAELTEKAVGAISETLDVLKNIRQEKVFEERFVGRRKLPTTVFSLLFHIAEHTARHVGQIVTTTKIVRGMKTD